MDEALIDRTKKHIEDRFRGDCTGHDHFHSIRVFNTATEICKKEGGDLLTVQLAALLHDVDDRKLFGTESHDASDFLRSNAVCGERAAAILGIISQISFKGTDTVVPSTLEGKIVQDADRLDAIGAIGIARAFAYGGNRKRKIYDPDIPPEKGMDSVRYFASEGTSINHFYEKLLKLKDMMNTNAAKAMAEERHAFMLSFLNEFYMEWNGSSAEIGRE
ncbi:MAG: HD domain-containing protein [Candidatus Methanomethylophilaceae archaeon]|jgi:uncharacterized protein